MNRTTLGRAIPIAVAALLLAGATPAAADDHRRKNETAPMKVTGLTPLLEDSLITDDMEAQIPAITAGGVTCKYESVINSPNSAPSTGSYQMIYVVSAGEAAASWLDVPRSCSDGSVRYSSLARSSRNMAAWMAAQDSGMNLRTLTYSYVHNYTGTTYSTRSVRRFASAYPEENWNNTPMHNGDRLAKLRGELFNAGFKASNTKYSVVLDAATYKECPERDAFGNPVCYHIPGIAIRGGAYSLSNRKWIDDNWNEQKFKFGCASCGDSVFNHEATHQAGAYHSYDHSRDLMSENGGLGYSMKSSPSILWDPSHNDYHGTVRDSGYAGLSEIPGNYFTC